MVSRLHDDSKDEMVFSRIAAINSNKNHINPYYRRTKQLTRKLSRVSSDSKDTFAKARFSKHGSGELELPDIYT